LAGGICGLAAVAYLTFARSKAIGRLFHCPRQLVLLLYAGDMGPVQTPDLSKRSFCPASKARQARRG